MEIESKNLEICKTIVHVCKKKIDYLKKFDYSQIDKLYHNSNVLVNELDLLKFNVTELYHIYPSTRM